MTEGSWRTYLSKMGPSWIAGAIAAGPATMASVITAGATFGYTLLWVVILSAILGATAQYLAMRLGLLTESGIVSVVEQHLGEGWAWVLVIDTVLAAGLAQLVIMKGVADISATVTGSDARIWGVTWAIILALGLAGHGYRFIELLAKFLVIAVVIAFFASLFFVPIDASGVAAGLIPQIPAGVDGALVAAGILGGAVHITLITMHSYTMHSKGWTSREYGLATFDVGTSMLIVFGIYSFAIFIVAAGVLHSPTVAAAELSAVAAAQALGPLVGTNAKWLFLLGLWGAAVSTLGGNTIVPPYLIADKLGWRTEVSDIRYRVLLAVVALLSGQARSSEDPFFRYWCLCWRSVLSEHHLPSSSYCIFSIARRSRNRTRRSQISAGLFSLQSLLFSPLTSSAPECLETSLNLYPCSSQSSLRCSESSPSL
ncbi:NRAMP family divalent metal transporter [Halocatena marina]|uniref:NRAMP family divalent metal transporter n=1 Tax=Halocatena marina TaxID=2934937 RepID=UPI003614F34F